MKKFVIVDFRISDEEKTSLKKLGFESLICPPCSKLYNAVCGHPDMLLHFLAQDKVIVHKDMPLSFVKKLNQMGLVVFYSMNSLEGKYPLDIYLNAVNTTDFFVHYTKYTDPLLLQCLNSKKILNVKQGYTKCSTAIVSPRAFITSDPSIKKSLEDSGADVLYVPHGDIILPGLDYGFIGGTCGLLENNVLAFYGDLNYYAYGKEVLSFLEKHNVRPVFLRKGKLIDRGSIFRGLEN